MWGRGNRLDGRLRFGARFTLIVLLLPLLGSAALAHSDGDEARKVSVAPLTSEQLALYKAVLDEWAEGDRSSINLSILTEPIQNSQIEPVRDCFKGHVFEKAVPNLVHRIREADLVSLGGHRLRLVDPDQHAQEVRANDPENAIHEGKSGEDLDKAVDNAFAHGLFTLGEIRFDKTHRYAFVSFSFWCGMLCGHGNTWLMKKSEGNWRQVKMCGGWVS